MLNITFILKSLRLLLVYLVKRFWQFALNFFKEICGIFCHDIFSCSFKLLMFGKISFATFTQLMRLKFFMRTLPRLKAYIAINFQTANHLASEKIMLKDLLRCYWLSVIYSHTALRTLVTFLQPVINTTFTESMPTQSESGWIHKHLKTYGAQQMLRNLFRIHKVWLSDYLLLVCHRICLLLLHLNLNLQLKLIILGFWGGSTGQKFRLFSKKN